MANEKEKDRKALVILPIFLAGGLAYYFWRRSVGAEPPPEPEPDKATLFGVVTDAVTGHPIQGVNVDCDGPAGAYSAPTASNGMYQFQNIEPGSYEVVFTKAGYDPVVV